MKTWMKRVIYGCLAVLVVVIVVRAFQPTPVLVDTALVERRPMLVSADDDGRTRVRERYTISAPIDGRLLRTPLRAGDPVVDGETLVAVFAPVTTTLLDARSQAQAEAKVQRATAALEEAGARLEQAEADFGYAEAELQRIAELTQRGIKTHDDLDRARRDRRLTFEGRRAATFGVQVAQFELELARASLVEPRSDEVEAPMRGAEDRHDGDVTVGADGRLMLRSPITGTVLRVHEESARTMPAGTAILELGNTGALEIVADYLSQDAVKIRSGMDVFVDGWGGLDERGRERVLQGRVRVVEPGGFTKISALGVEEQRVNVIVDPVGDDAAWATLGDGFRVELRIVLWSADDVLVVPVGALFREREAWAVYVVEGGRACRRTIEIGRINGLEAQVVSGLVAGDRVVLYPSELIADDSPVELR